MPDRMDERVNGLLKEAEELDEPLPLSVVANLFRNAYYAGYEDAHAENSIAPSDGEAA